VQRLTLRKISERSKIHGARVRYQVNLLKR